MLPVVRRSASPRCGFTLVELLVVITIIGVLVSLTMPAVMQALESGRRLQCLNNLRQLGLSVAAYAEAHNDTLPPSGNYATTNQYGEIDMRSGTMLSWVVSILPYIEQKGLYDKFNLARSALDQPNEPQATQLAFMLCPSDGGRNRFFADSALTQGKRFGKGNYAAYVSPFHTDLQLQYPGAFTSKGQRVADILDGTSYTVMLAEVRTFANEGDQRGAWALAWTGASVLAFDMHQDFFASSSRYYVPSPWSLGLTQPPNNQGPNVDMLYACPDMSGAQIERMPCETWESSGERRFLSAAPRSQHPGGVNVVFADGHTAFLSNDIDEITMAYLVSANDNQPVDMSKAGQ